MKRRPRTLYTDSQKALMWARWKKGESLHQIAQLLNRNHSSVSQILAETGAATDDALSVTHGLVAPNTLAKVYLERGIAYGYLHEVAKARDSNELAVDFGRQADQVSIQAAALNNICDEYLEEKNYTKAEALCGQAQKLFKVVVEFFGLAATQVNVGLAKMGMGKVTEGAAVVRTALKLLEDAEKKAEQIYLLQSFGDRYEQLNMYREAVVTHREQQKLSESLSRMARDKAVTAMRELRYNCDARRDASQLRIFSVIGRARQSASVMSLASFRSALKASVCWRANCSSIILSVASSFKRKERLSKFVDPTEVNNSSMTITLQ